MRRIYGVSGSLALRGINHSKIYILPLCFEAQDKGKTNSLFFLFSCFYKFPTYYYSFLCNSLVLIPFYLFELNIELIVSRREFMMFSKKVTFENIKRHQESRKIEIRNKSIFLGSISDVSPHIIFCISFLDQK